MLAAIALCCLVSGTISAPSGAPVAGARVVLNGGAAASTTSDARGDFAVTASPGRYLATVTAGGFGAAEVGLDVTADTRLAVVLEPLDSGKFRTIASVTVDGKLAVVRNAIPSTDVTRADLDRLGYDRLIQGIGQVPSTTLPRPDGGAPTGVAVVALRGPDPSESIVALDGQVLNDGNTGDVDLSQIPVAAFSNVNVTEGLGPSDSEGSNTFGGAVNLLSLQPTQKPHGALSFAGGSYGTTDLWYNATGSAGKFGYAAALDDYQQGGYVNEVAPVCVPSSAPNGCTPSDTHLGSSIAARTALANVVWNFSPNADVGFRFFTTANERDVSGTVNGIDLREGSPTFGQLVGPGNDVFSQNVRAYLLHGRAPLGAGSVQMEASVSDDGINLTGGGNGGVSPYDTSHIDVRDNLSLQWGRTFADSEFAFGGYTRYESLTGTGISPTQAQQIQSLFLRGALAPSRRVHLSGGVFESHYSTFGGNLDGRVAASYDLDASSALRFSLGTGFRAPLLIERYVFPLCFPNGSNFPCPAGALHPDVNDVYPGQGNPIERPEHATEYELGYSHQFGAFANVDVSLYHTNLRDPIENVYPLDYSRCSTVVSSPQACISYPTNIGNAVYEGAEVRFRQRVVPAHLFFTAQYGLNVAYPRNLGALVSNPTSGGSLVNNQQFLGVPQQVGSLEIDYEHADWHGGIAGAFRGNNNELFQGPYSQVNAAVGKRFGSIDVTVAATNVFNDASSSRFTLLGDGVPYNGVVGRGPAPDHEPILGPLPTNRLFLQPAAVRLIVTVRR